MCSINTRGGARGEIYTYTSPRETLATISSRPNSETLALCEVLAHPRAIFHPCTCGVRGGTTVVAVALISYDDLGLLPRRPRGGDNHDQLLSLH
jgi:hypothetical protein